MADESAPDRATHPSDRTYFRIQPADVAVAPAAVEQALTDLHAIDAGRGGLLSRNSTAPPTIEVLLTTGGEGSLAYHVGITPADHDDALERALRQCLPRSYDITTTETTHADLLALPQRPDEPTDTPLALPDEWDVAGVTFEGVGDRRDDWTTSLPSLTPENDHRDPTYPLADAASALADADVPAAFQAVLRPKGDYRATADDYVFRLENGYGIGNAIAEFFFGPTDPEERTLSTATKERLDAIDEKDAQHSFTVNARAVACGPNARTTERLITTLRSAFSGLSGSYYRIEPTVAAYGSDDAHAIRDRLADRTIREEAPLLRRLRLRLPVTRNNRLAIIADTTSAGHFCVLDGPSLPPAADRAIDTTPPERTGQPLPSREVLERYLDVDGMPLGRPLTADRQPLDGTVTLPPALQRLHTGVFGASGSGKSLLMLLMALHNHGTTDGASIILDSKGDGNIEQYLQAHYARYGDLENIYYFDCAKVLPALSVLTIEPLLDAGIGREQAVETVATHYTELLTGFMGEERFESAVRSPDVIHYFIKALFDPVHGQDSVSHYDLERAVTRLRQTGEPPSVTDDRLREQLAGLATTHQRSLDRVLAGVATRIEKATRDSRLATLFDHVPSAAGPTFDLRDVLDEDCVVVLDTSGYQDAPHRMLTLLVLSQVWTALKRRHAVAPDADRPLVNLYVEEAADVAPSGILADLLSKGRSFGLGVTLAMQFPGQLRADHPRVYRELLNDVGTVVAGRVGVDDDLAARFATDATPPDEVANRLRALDRGDWLVRLPAPFADDTPQPFRCASLPLPPGHPESTNPLTEGQQAAVDAQIAMAAHRTAREHGLTVETRPPAGDAPMPTGAAAAPTDAADGTTAESTATAADGPASAATETAPSAASAGPEPIRTALQFTDRMPPTVDYEAGADALVCNQCGQRYRRTVAGMRRAIECCHDIDAVDRDDIPIIDLSVKLTPDEIAASGYSRRQLALLQAVHTAQHRGYDDELEYDLLHDSMLRLREYVGIEHDAVTELVDDGLLRDDCDYPHKLYSVSPAGRDLLNAPLQEGVDYGDGVGDLGESSEHAMAVDLGVELIEQVFVPDGDSAVVEAVSYHTLDDDTCLDAAGLDSDGDVAVAIEAERTNNDLGEGVPADYDKLAGCDPEEAIWIAMDRGGGHAVLRALNEPGDGTPRVTKTYSEGTPPRQFSIDAPGCTQIYTVGNVKNMLEV